ncbi:MAG TPA: lipopolysaccharide assembly protein LapA domain-containing protein [Bacillales bacterium]|nr:lipopolysaccharide assembly protein LapA domain-containing protein [Bacillales bacterium]
MKGQWGLLLGLIFALIVAIFAVINVEPVTVDYLFGTSRWPLVIVILASALLGALVVGAVGMFRVFRLNRENRRLGKKNGQLEAELEKYTGNLMEVDSSTHSDELPSDKETSGEKVSQQTDEEERDNQNSVKSP